MSLNINVVFLCRLYLKADLLKCLKRQRDRVLESRCIIIFAVSGLSEKEFFAVY